jgi:hypothetical protein
MIDMIEKTMIFKLWLKSCEKKHFSSTDLTIDGKNGEKN